MRCVSVDETTWEKILENVAEMPGTIEEKKQLLLELAAMYGRTLTPADYAKAGIIE